MRATISCFVLFLAYGVACADSPLWMKKDNPETLHTYVRSMAPCPITTDELAQLTNGVLIRSRIKPGDYIHGGQDFGIYLVLDCDRADSPEQYLYTFQLHFVRNVEDRDMLEEKRYGGYGVGRHHSITRHVQRQMETIVTHYLQANFNLSSD